MAKENFYARAREAFDELEVGERVSARGLAERIGAEQYQDRKKVAAFLSQQAQKGKVKKHVGEDLFTYYEKLFPLGRPKALRAGTPKKARETKISSEIGESIVSYIEKLKAKIETLERERDQFQRKLSTLSKQKEEFKRLYQQAEEKAKQFSSRQQVARKTVLVTKASTGD